jgi:hypothetical protein
MRRKTLAILISCTLTTLFLDATYGFSSSLIVTSQSTSLRAGAEIDDDAVIELGAQEQLRVMNNKTGETKVLLGPYKGTVSAYTNPCSGNSSMSENCSHGPHKQPVGASRGLLRN